MVQPTKTLGEQFQPGHMRLGTGVPNQSFQVLFWVRYPQVRWAAPFEAHGYAIVAFDCDGGAGSRAPQSGRDLNNRERPFRKQ